MNQTPGEELINQLDQLRQQLNRLVDKLNTSGVERTHGLKEIMGRDCDFYKKSLDLFLQKDYISLRNLCASIHGVFETIEGRSSNE